MFQVNALAGSVPSSGSVPFPENEMTSPATKKLPSWGDRMVAVGRAADADRDRRRERRVHAVRDRQPRRVLARLGRRCGSGWPRSTCVLSPNVHE